MYHAARGAGLPSAARVMAAAFAACAKLDKQDKQDGPEMRVTDQFGTLQLEEIPPFQLCVPSSKTALP